MNKFEQVPGYDVQRGVCISERHRYPKRRWLSQTGVGISEEVGVPKGVRMTEGDRVSGGTLYHVTYLTINVILPPTPPLQPHEHANASENITFQQLPWRDVMNHLQTPMEGSYTSLKVYFLQTFHILFHRNPSSVDTGSVACNLQCPILQCRSGRTKQRVGIFNINAPLHCKVFKWIPLFIGNTSV